MVKHDCIYHRYESEENYTLDMCSKHPEKLYGVTASDCDVCEKYIPECSYVSTQNDSHNWRSKMELPGYIGIKNKQFSHYQFETYDDGVKIGISKLHSEEEILDAVETVIMKGYTFEVFEVNRITVEYEGEDGNMEEFSR